MYTYILYPTYENLKMNLQIFYMLCLMVTIYGDPKPIVSRPDSNLHFSGTEAAEGQFPYQVSLMIFGLHSCGGSILNSNWILTAAHCVENYSPVELSVLVGTTNLHSSGTVYGVSKIISHEVYDRIFIRNDVAVVKLSESITFNKNVQPIQLETKYIHEVDCIVSGWGYTSGDLYFGDLPNELQFLELKSISVSECKEHWNIYKDNYTFVEVFDSEICTFTRYGEGVCKGDSGGPLIANGKQIGIVSWAKPCARGVPDVFTRVSSYYDWIQNAISTNGDHS